jgi:hypothetical protein
MDIQHDEQLVFYFDAINLVKKIVKSPYSCRYNYLCSVTWMILCAHVNAHRSDIVSRESTSDCA